MLSRGQSWHDKRSVKTVTLTTMDSLLVSPRFDSWQHIYEKKKPKKKPKKKHDYKWNVTHNRVSLLAHVFLTISGRFCVKLIFSTCQIIRLSDARPREHVDSGSGGGRHIGIRGRPQPYFGKSAGWDLCPDIWAGPPPGDSTQVLRPILRPCLNVDWLKFRAHQTAEKRERYDSFLSEIKNCDRS